MWAWLDRIYFTYWMTKEFFSELEYVFDNSIGSSIVYSE